MASIWNLLEDINFKLLNARSVTGSPCICLAPADFNVRCSLHRQGLEEPRCTTGTAALATTVAAFAIPEWVGSVPLLRWCRVTARLTKEVVTANKFWSLSSFTRSTRTVSCVGSNITIPCNVAPDVLPLLVHPVGDGQSTEVGIINGFKSSSGTVKESKSWKIWVANCFPAHKVVWNMISVECHCIILVLSVLVGPHSFFPDALYSVRGSGHLVVVLVTSKYPTRISHECVLQCHCVYISLCHSWILIM